MDKAPISLPLEFPILTLSLRENHTAAAFVRQVQIDIVALGVSTH
jgi:hypothetical protein